MSRALLASVAAAAVAASASEMSLRMPQAQAPYGDAGAITGHATGLDGQNGRMLQANPLVTVAAPPLGSSADVTGSVSGLPSAPSNFKVGILVSPDGTTWWDKTHDYPAGVPNTNPIEGIMLTGSGTFDIMGWVSSPNDPTCTYIRVVLVPQSFSFLWPAYQVEGVAWPTNFYNPSTTTAMTTVNRATGAVTNWLPSDGTGLPAVPNGAAAAPSPAASVAASPAAAAASPSAPAAGASPSSAPAAASPSSAAAAPSSASQPSATSNALPNGGASSSPVVSNVPAASPSGAAQTPVASGAGGTHAAVSALLGSLAAAVAGVALLA